MTPAAESANGRVLGSNSPGLHCMGRQTEVALPRTVCRHNRKANAAHWNYAGPRHAYSQVRLFKSNQIKSRSYRRRVKEK